MQKLKTTCPACSASIFKSDPVCPECGYHLDDQIIEEEANPITNQVPSKVGFAKKSCPSCSAAWSWHLALVRGAGQARRNTIGGSRGEEEVIPAQDLKVYEF